MSGFVGWIFSRNKNRAETTGIDLANAKEIIDMYKELSEDFKTSIDNLRKLNQEQQESIMKFTSRCVQINKCKE